MKVKFRELKRECRFMVENFRAKLNDDEEMPEFLIHTPKKNQTSKVPLSGPQRPVAIKVQQERLNCSAAF